MAIVWGVIAGVFLAGGHYFMSRAAQTIDFGSGVVAALTDALQNQYVYLFLFLNLCATVSYILCLRNKQLIDGFVVITVTTSATVFLVSLVMVRTQLTGLQTTGLVMAVIGVVLMNRPV